MPGSDTLIHLVGVSHPSPSKAEQFRTIDFGSMRASVLAASQAQVGHFIYISVAQPAPVMKAYIKARAEAEALLSESHLNCTNSQTLVCPRTGTSLALCSAPPLLAARTISHDGKIRKAAWTAQATSNSRCISPCGRTSGYRVTHPGSSTNSSFLRKFLQVMMEMRSEIFSPDVTSWL